MAILTHRLLSEGKQVGIGATGAMFVTLSGVAKTSGPSAPYCLANEVVCADLGRVLGLPVPPYTIIELPVKQPDRPQPVKAFSSLDFNLQGVALPPVNPVECVRLLPDLCTGLILFDILVLNGDRHAGNLNLDTTGHPRLTVFDHSHALLGTTAGQAAQHLAGVGATIGIGGQCLLAHLTTDQHMQKWLGRIEQIPDFMIDDLATAATDLGCSGDEATALASFLKARRSNIRQIIQAHQASFPGIAQWSLFNVS